MSNPRIFSIRRGGGLGVVVVMVVMFLPRPLCHLRETAGAHRIRGWLETKFIL